MRVAATSLTAIAPYGPSPPGRPFDCFLGNYWEKTHEPLLIASVIRVAAWFTVAAALFRACPSHSCTQIMAALLTFLQSVSYQILCDLLLKSSSGFFCAQEIVA